MLLITSNYNLAPSEKLYAFANEAYEVSVFLNLVLEDFRIKAQPIVIRLQHWDNKRGVALPGQGDYRNDGF